jgi:DNA-binding NarL/FixJ family response regulator
VLAAAPATRVVCLTASVTKAEIADLLAAGAVACLTKDEDFDSIVAAIEAAAHR